MNQRIKQSNQDGILNKNMTTTSYAVSSDLTGDAYDAARAIWDDLERRYGLRAAKEAIHPHVTYVVGDGDRSDILAARVAAVAAATPPFEIELDGVGSFDGARPVVFMRVVKSPALVDTYEAMHAAARSVGLALWPLYAPQVWTPHVTLALKDTSPELLPMLLADLGARKIHFRARIATISLVEVVLPEHTYIGTYPCAGVPSV